MNLIDKMNSLQNAESEFIRAQEEFYKASYGQAPDFVLQEKYEKVIKAKQKLDTYKLLKSGKDILGKSNEYLPLLEQCFKIVSNEKEFKGGTFEPVAQGI